MSALSFFPLKTPPRPQQSQLIEVIRKVFEDGVKTVILESPVGSGKSAIAMSLARYFSGSHTLTPRKSLQNQYLEDFDEHVVLMKGRGSYPCVLERKKGVFIRNEQRYREVSNKIKDNELIQMFEGERSTAEGPCLTSNSAKGICLSEDELGCPYRLAASVAMREPHVVHNVHSFIFQTQFAAWFDKKPLMIVDEAHTLEGVIRGFLTKSFKCTKNLSKLLSQRGGKFPGSEDITGWVKFLTHPDVAPDTPRTEKQQAEYEQYHAKIEAIGEYSKFTPFVVEVKCNEESFGSSYSFNFIPTLLGNKPTDLIFQFGERVLLMSGTIYDKALFCRQLGLKPEEVHFIRTGSTFPVKNRPIIAKPEYMVSTAHRDWEDNLPQLVENIRKVLGVFQDAKGLIHAPSYYAARQIIRAVNDPRLVTHDKHDFLPALESFYSLEGNNVFVSPTCFEGVDFKGDRARFQLILRVPYPSAGDPFMEYMIKNNWPWYNLQALMTFGQQLGRINRGPSDYGVTVLMDSRFHNFIARNKKSIPQWVHEAIVTS